ncbi:MAG: hypothetical protein M1269_03955 [Chloroflexi bacterium]|nr:hypothetical protein [Chloroflexota bacterium]
MRMIRRLSSPLVLLVLFAFMAGLWLIPSGCSRPQAEKKPAAKEEVTIKETAPEAQKQVAAAEQPRLKTAPIPENVPAAGRQDPFIPLQIAAPPIITKTEINKPPVQSQQQNVPYILTGIIKSGSSFIAVFTGSSGSVFAKIGDALDPQKVYRVKNITENSATVVGQGNTEKIMLEAEGGRAKPMLDKGTPVAPPELPGRMRTEEQPPPPPPGQQGPQGQQGPGGEEGAPPPPPPPGGGGGQAPPGGGDQAPPTPGQ